MARVVPDPPIVGQKNCPNFQRILMPTRPPKLPNPTSSNTTPGSKKCQRKRCVTCRIHLKESGKFNSVFTKQRYFIKDELTCDSSNIIYLIDCTKCNKTQYVGETGNPLRKRFSKHRSDVTTKKPTLVAQHFNSHEHELTDMKITPIEKVSREDVPFRKEREKYWRHRLRTNYPDGLNVFD